MMTRLLCCLLWAVAFVLVQGQGLTYHSSPREIWRQTFNAIGEGNGVYLTPTHDMLVAVSRVGILRAYNPDGGEILWTFSPPLIGGGSVSCQSGITFVETSAATYLAYMVVDTAAREVST